MTDPLIIDVDATLVTSHSDKENAKPTFKKGYGFHPLCAFLDHARDSQGLGGALLVEELDGLGIDCHRLILDTAAGLLADAQRHGTARPALTADDLRGLLDR